MVTLLQPGSSYKFKYRGINAFGEGEFSDESTIVAATKPDTISRATTVIIGSDVKISWTSPSGRGSVVTSYAVYIGDDEGVMVLYEEECAGTGPSVLNYQECTVPLATLRDAAQFNLAQEDLVVAQITATNDFGTSELSEKNTVGAEIQTEPHQPSTPPSRGTQTS